MKFFSWRQAILKSSLPSTTRHVLLTLACHMNDAGESCYPSIELLCEETGLSNKAVITHLQNAADAGWIVVEKHGFKGRRWARNEYRIAWPEIIENAIKAVNDVHHLDARGSERRSNEAVNDVHTSTSVNSPEIVTTPLRSVVTISTSAPSSATPPEKPQTGIRFDPEKQQFTNIQPEQYAKWDEAYKRIDVDAEIEKAELWLVANPKKRKQNYLRFLTGWFTRATERIEQPRRQLGKPHPAGAR